MIHCQNAHCVLILPIDFELYQLSNSGFSKKAFNISAEIFSCARARVCVCVSLGRSLVMGDKMR